MRIIKNLSGSYFLEPGQMLVDPWYNKDYKLDVDGYFDLWRYYDDIGPHTIEVWLGYKRKAQIKRDGGVFFNEGKYGHMLEIINMFVADREDVELENEYPGYEWVKVGEWGNR